MFVIKDPCNNTFVKYYTTDGVEWTDNIYNAKQFTYEEQATNFIHSYWTGNSMGFVVVNLTSKFDWTCISEEHRKELEELYNKYKEEDKKTWMNENFPEDYENTSVSKVAINKFVKELKRRVDSDNKIFDDKQCIELSKIIKEMGVE